MKSFKGYISVVLKNKTVRFYVFVFFGLLINACYIIFNLVSGIIYGNAWFITVAAYYTLIVSVRYLILGNGQYDRVGYGSTFDSIKAVKNCGILMLILGVPITGMIIYTVISDRTYEYSTFVFVLLFVYAAFSILRAAYGIFTSGKKSVMSNAFHYIRISSALMSLFNLQTSVLSAIVVGGVLAKTINTSTGGAVSLSVFWFAVKTIKQSDIILHELIEKKEFYK